MIGAPPVLAGYGMRRRHTVRAWVLGLLLGWCL